jgi:pterin-4a-carbinolamine dehydratase
MEIDEYLKKVIAPTLRIAEVRGPDQSVGSYRLEGLEDRSGKGAKITKEYKFKNFAEALSFVNRVGEIAEKEGHHPDINFGWGYVTITLQTHSINGLSRNDFILAVKINEISVV